MVQHEYVTLYNHGTHKEKRQSLAKMPDRKADSR